MTSSSPESDNKPVVIYDGRCSFCGIWIRYWQQLTAGRVEYAAAQDVAAQYPEITAEEFKGSVWLVYPDGKRISGAEAAFALMAYVPERAWPQWCYRHVPGFRFLTETFYRFIAGHRELFYILTRVFWGKEIEPGSHRWPRSLFLRGLGVVYLTAFLSLAPQIVGLAGQNGLLPSQTYSDTSLLTLCWSGVALALALALGILPVPATAGLFVLYFLVSGAGQEFLWFQWDTLLLETGFAAILLAPFGLRPSYSQQPSAIALWVQRLLVFRLMIESGLVKWQSGDPTWRSLTALEFHYETQPLPTPVAWYAHHLPPGFQNFSTAAVFVLELGVPLLFLMPRRFRLIGAWTTICFQLLIAITGNYGFFNLLTIVVCFTLMDDQHLRRFMPGSLQRRAGIRVSRMKPLRPLVNAVGIFLIGVGLLQLAGFRTPVDRYQIVNRYGLFAVMTTSRPEIIIEGSDDGEEWRPYEFKFKPGDLNRAPRWAAPYHPRLDWQMWFAALGSYSQNPWFESLMLRLLEGSPEVIGLLQTNPFPDSPPRFVRALVYDYHFSDGGDAWWRRELLGEYFPAVSLRR